MSSLRDADPRQLGALVAAVEHGTFARAAAALGFTQSAVSQQISSLEKHAGVALFDRPKGPRPAELTHAGRLVLEFARTTLGNIERMDDELDRLRRGIAGRLRVGTFQSVSAELLPAIVGAMRRDAPDVEVQLDETEEVEDLMRAILDGSLDLAFTIDAADDPRITIDVLGTDPFVVLGPPERANGSTVTAAELNTHPLIGQPDTDTCQVMIDQRLLAAGVRPDYVFRFHHNGAVQNMVRTGMGWAVMPSLATDPDDPGVSVLRLDPPIPPRTIQLIRRADRTLPIAADQFTTISRTVGARLLDQ